MAGARKTRAKARPIKSLELFTGAGGLALGTHLAGLHHVALLEWNGDACRTLRENAEARVLPGVEKWQVLESDVRDVTFSDFGEVDVISGGPPCQPFSIGGKHSGFDDWRNMIPQFCRAIRELTPRAFIMENVKGLLRPRFETYFSYILLSLSYPTIAPKPREAWTDHLARLEKGHTSGKFDDLHYHVVFRLLNAADYGCRRRGRGYSSLASGRTSACSGTSPTRHTIHSMDLGNGRCLDRVVRARVALWRGQLAAGRLLVGSVARCRRRCFSLDHLWSIARELRRSRSASAAFRHVYVLRFRTSRSRDSRCATDSDCEAAECKVVDCLRRVRRAAAAELTAALAAEARHRSAMTSMVQRGGRA